jgi:hypothetical protein
MKHLKNFEGWFSKKPVKEIQKDSIIENPNTKRPNRTKVERLKTAEDVLTAFEQKYDPTCKKDWYFYEIVYNAFLNMDPNNFDYITKEQFKLAFMQIFDFKDDWMNSDKEREIIKSKLLSSYIWDNPPHLDN